MRVLRCCTVCLLVLALLFCTGCAARDGFDGGEPLSAEELAALQAQLAAQEEGAPEEGGEIPPDATVFWLDGGKVYHVVATCYHIAKKENVRQGTLAEALEAGKERPCSVCID